VSPPSFGERLLRIAAAGWNDIEEWRLGDAARAAARGFPRRVPSDVLDDSGIVFVDVTLEARTGRPVCHEVNGPNGVGSDALTGDSGERAESEAGQALRRAAESGHRAADGRLVRPVVTVHAHQHWRAFRTGGEFYPRVGRFAESLAARLPRERIEVRGAGEAFGTESVSVVVGDVPSVAEHLEVERRSGGFLHRGRPVVFLGNPNLACELVRRGRLRLAGGRFLGADLRVFHAWRLVHAVHDKALQQALFEGTALRPLARFEAGTRAEAVRRTRAMLRTGPVVLKPNGGSGGTGVQVAVPGMGDDEVAAKVDALFSECAAKHGEGVESFAFPVRGFEFVRSTGYPTPAGEHLWDLRVAVAFEPGVAAVYPVSLRIAPKPFDEASFHLDRDRWISNVSGRRESLLKSGLDEEALRLVGFTDERLEEVLRACVAWTERAWDAAVRDATPLGASYEDVCERTDPDFVPARSARP
jgi:hypothetical protein